LVFLRQTKVFAQAFDAERLELQGSPFEVADGALGCSTSFALTLSAGAGAVAFRAATARIGKQFAWFGRSGNPIETVDDVLEALTMALSLSPDGSRLVFFQRGENASDLWLLETRRGVRSRFTNHPAEDIFPVWSRDGRYIVFRSNRNGGWALYQKRTTGTDPEELLLNAVRDETFAIDTSPDGQWLLYQQRNEKTGWDILALSRRGDAKPVPVIQTDADERGGLLSPDGKWLAYVANTSGPLEVYVQAFPGPGPKIQVSTKGGDSIRWRSNGRELFYIALDGKLMAAPIQVVADGKSIDVGTPVPLFTTRMGRTISSAEYVVSDDGQRFLMNTVVQDAGRTPLRVILNWKAQPSSR